MTSVVNSNGLSPQWQSFLSVTDDVLPWMQMDKGYPLDGTSEQTNLALVTDAVCAWMQDLLGRPIGPTVFNRRYDGGDTTIALTWSPVLDVSAVTEYRTNQAYPLSEYNPANPPATGGYAWQCDYQTGRLVKVSPGGWPAPWFPGSRNIQVTWTAGYNPIPGNLRLAALELVAHWWRNLQQQSAARAPGLTAQNEYDPGSNAPGPFEGMPDRVRLLLSPYMQVGIG